MITSRVSRLTSVVALFSFMLLTTLVATPALAMPAPDQVDSSGFTPSAITTVVHTHTSFWTYAAIAAVSVAATVIVGALALWSRSQLRNVRLADRVPA